MAGKADLRPLVKIVSTGNFSANPVIGLCATNGSNGLVSSRRSGSRLECPVGISGSFRNRPIKAVQVFRPNDSNAAVGAIGDAKCMRIEWPVSAVLLTFRYTFSFVGRT